MGLAIAVVTPITIAATSPLLAWRSGIYIAAGFAGIIALTLLLFQPLLARGLLPGLSGPVSRRIHHWFGSGLVIMVALHVAGLWLTSAPDVIDALLFQSPTSFSPWGVIAMWAVFASALIAVLRWKLQFSPKAWRIIHTSLAIVIVIGSVVHAILIEGAMGQISKVIFCVLVILATAKAMMDLRIWTLFQRRKR